MFSVELIPDAELDRAVRDDWDRLLAADLPSSGRNPAPSNRPHMTLAVRDRLDPAEFGAVGDLLPVALELAGVVVLGHRDRYVLARHVVVSAQLLAIHRAVASLAAVSPRASVMCGVHRSIPVFEYRGSGRPAISATTRWIARSGALTTTCRASTYRSR